MLAYLVSLARRMPWFEKGRWQQLRGWTGLLLLRILVLVLLGVHTAAVRWALHECFAGWVKRNLLRIEHITTEKMEHLTVRCLWHRWPWLFSQIWSPLSFWGCTVLPPTFLIITDTSPVEESFYPWGSPQGSPIGLFFIPASTFSPWLMLFASVILAVLVPWMSHRALCTQNFYPDVHITVLSCLPFPNPSSWFKHNAATKLFPTVENTSILSLDPDQGLQFVPNPSSELYI